MKTALLFYGNFLSMRKYRIREETYASGECYYKPQYKIFGMWCDLTEWSYKTKDEAQFRIDSQRLIRTMYITNA